MGIWWEHPLKKKYIYNMYWLTGCAKHSFCGDVEWCRWMHTFLRTFFQGISGKQQSSFWRFASWSVTSPLLSSFWQPMALNGRNSSPILPGLVGFRRRNHGPALVHLICDPAWFWSLSTLNWRSCGGSKRIPQTPQTLIYFALTVEVQHRPLQSGAVVEVRQCSLRSGARSWGPAVPTEIWSRERRGKRGGGGSNADRI